MAIFKVLLFLSVIAVLSWRICCQYFIPDGQDENIFQQHSQTYPSLFTNDARNNFEAEVAPPGTSSLVFVFDTTGSMYDDLVQVRDGARKIFATVLEQRQALIHNYVLVPFHDPEVGPVFVTSATDTFQKVLHNLYVQGGGDCPEMSITGIKLALTTALPSSFIYVFTDARAKDYHLTPEVLNLVEERQSQVVFVMTGDCGNRSHPGYVAFEQIAAASNGQVFHLEKSDVNEVLNYVRVSVQTRKLYIATLDKKTGGTYLTNFPVDSRITDFTISIAGELPELELLNPRREKVSEADGVSKQIVNLANVVIVTVSRPMAGLWQIKATARSKHSLRITGNGAIDFSYNFAQQTTAADFGRSHAKLPKGIPTHAMIKVSGLLPPGLATEVSLVDVYGNVAYAGPLTQSAVDPHLYSSPQFEMYTDGFYFVKVSGVDDRNFEFQRISTTAIGVQSSSGPMVYMAPRTVVVPSRNATIDCRVVSNEPFSLYWMNNGRRVAGPIYFSNTETARWDVPAVDRSQNSATYTCLVVSAAGNSSATTQLQLAEYPPIILSISNATAVLRSVAYLTCRTQAENGATSLSWYKKDASNVRFPHHIVFKNGTLKIDGVVKADEGSYVCEAVNSAGRDSAEAYLSITSLPTVSVEPATLYFTSKGTFNMTCTVDFPASKIGLPKLEWFHNGRRLRLNGNQRYSITNNKQLFVRRATEQDAGEYECRVTNAAGTASAASRAIFAVLPRISVNPAHAMLNRGETATFHCQVTGNPAPRITWLKNNRELPSSDRGRLSIPSVQDSDSGSYFCIAENIAGRSSAEARLTIGSLPSILASSETVAVHIEKDVTLQCKVIASPKAQINWTRDEHPVYVNPRMKLQPDGGLLIRNATLDDAGRYTCTATNKFGSTSIVRTLVIAGLVVPVLDHVPSEAQVIEGESMRLSCTAALGTPSPTLIWLKNNSTFFMNSGNYEVLQNGEVLLVKSASVADEGRFSCLATNAAGNSSLNITLRVLIKPSILSNKREYVANEEGSVELPCVTTGSSPISISWQKNEQPLFAHTILPSGSLSIASLSLSDEGTYHCIATNVAGMTTERFRLKVLGKPRIRDAEVLYNVRKGGRISLPCETQGDPKPTVKWLFDGRHIADDRQFRTETNNSLLIMSARAEDSGEYKCIATNSVGRAERVLVLQVHRRE